MFALVVRFDLPDGASAREFDELTAAAVPLIHSHEPGTLVYETYAVEGEPLARLFYEVYRDRGAHGEHERQPHTAKFLATIATLVAQTRVEYLSQVEPSARVEHAT
ncbi:MAG TPA: antibiotic biosynthesis monooxygenase [Acidothermaceae bacterium]